MYKRQFSNLALEDGQSRLSTNGSINSATRTKTVSFNHKGDTEEAIKLSLQKKSLDDGTVSSRLKNFDAGVGGLTSMEQANDQSMPTKGDCLSIQDVGTERCVSIEPPPGFETLGCDRRVKVSPSRKLLLTERRVTRSQNKLEKSNSQVTSESMRKLAAEALEIGKILGVKVIAREENAKRQIIDSLKEKRKRKAV